MKIAKTREDREGYDYTPGSRELQALALIPGPNLAPSGDPAALSTLSMAPAHRTLPLGYSSTRSFAHSNGARATISFWRVPFKISQNEGFL